MAQNYPKFRGLLRGAICNRTQAQFANESGISAEHLSRMLNAETIHRPTKSTLHKIAAVAKNGVTFQLMMDTLDSEDGTVSHPSERRVAQAQRDFAKPDDFRQMAKDTMEMLCDSIKARTYPVIAPSIADHVSDIVEGIQDQMGNPLPVAYEIGKPRRNFGTNCAHATHYVTVFLSMADTDETATSEMMVNFTEVPCGGDRVQYAIQKVSCAVEDIMDQYGTNGAMLEFAEAEAEAGAIDVGTDGDEPPEPLCVDLGLPYYLDFKPVERFKEVYHGQGDTPEERIMDKIFGHCTRWAETIDGTGLPIREVPENLATFLAQHMKPVLDAYDGPDEDEQEIYAKLEAAIKEWGVLEDSPGVAKELDEIGYQDSETNGDKGWPAAVAEVMRAETGFPFYWHAPAEDKAEFTGLSEYGCIMVRVEDQERDGIQREALLFAISRYAKALGISHFGDLLFTGVRESFRKPKTYVVKEGTGDDEEAPVRETPDMSVRFAGPQDGPWPEEDGLYAVELKDGRKVTMLYLRQPGHGIWVKAHKEWSHMIAAYCPDKLPDPEPTPEPEQNPQ